MTQSANDGFGPFPVFSEWELTIYHTYRNDRSGSFAAQKRIMLRFCAASHPDRSDTRLSPITPVNS